MEPNTTPQLANNTAIAQLSEPTNFNTLVKLARWCNPTMPDHALEARIMQEISYFEYACMLNENLATCDFRSVMMMVRWVIQNDLSIDTQAGLMYLKTRNIKQASGGFVKVLEYEPSPEGALSMAYSTGEIIDHQRPVVHYDGSEKPKVVSVDFSFQLHNGRWETVSYAEGHFRKWRLASHTQNAYGANDADMVKMNKANKSYTSFNGGIDPEFCTGKAIKHGLDKRGTNRIAPKKALGTGQVQYDPLAPVNAERVKLGDFGRPMRIDAPAFTPLTDAGRLDLASQENRDYLTAIRESCADVAAIESMEELDELMEEGDMQEMHADSQVFRDAVSAAIARLSLKPTGQPVVAIVAEGFAPTPTPIFSAETIAATNVVLDAAIASFTPPATPTEQSAIPLDFAPDPIYSQLALCATTSDISNLFVANKEKVLASDTIKAAFKKREIEINEANIAAQSQANKAPAASPAPSPAPASPKITANDL